MTVPLSSDKAKYALVKTTKGLTVFSCYPLWTLSVWYNDVPIIPTGLALLIVPEE